MAFTASNGLTEAGTSKTIEAGGMTIHYHDVGAGVPRERLRVPRIGCRGLMETTLHRVQPCERCDVPEREPWIGRFPGRFRRGDGVLARRAHIPAHEIGGGCVHQRGRTRQTVCGWQQLQCLPGERNSTLEIA